MEEGQYYDYLYRPNVNVWSLVDEEYLRGEHNNPFYNRVTWEYLANPVPKFIQPPILNGTSLALFWDAQRVEGNSDHTGLTLAQIHPNGIPESYMNCGIQFRRTFLDSSIVIESEVVNGMPERISGLPALFAPFDENICMVTSRQFALPVVRVITANLLKDRPIPHWFSMYTEIRGFQEVTTSDLGNVWHIELIKEY